MAAGEVLVAGAYRRIIEEGRDRPGCRGVAIGGEAHLLLPSPRMAQTPEMLASVDPGGGAMRVQERRG